MAEQNEESESTPDTRLGRAIARGMLVGIPLSLVGMTFAIWGITDLEFVDAIATALLPGTLLGGFGGGFVGLASTMNG